MLFIYVSIDYATGRSRLNSHLWFNHKEQVNSKVLSLFKQLQDKKAHGVKDMIPSFMLH